MGTFELVIHNYGTLDAKSSKRWIRISNLPMQFWSESLFRAVGDFCGSFLEMHFNSPMTMNGIRIKSKKVENYQINIIREGNDFRNFFITEEMLSQKNGVLVGKFQAAAGFFQKLGEAVGQRTSGPTTNIDPTLILSPLNHPGPSANLMDPSRGGVLS